MAETTEFSVGDMVEWTSQANGSYIAKIGTVVAIVPPKTKVYKVIEKDKSLEMYDYWTAIDSRTGSRSATSYLIAVATKTPRGRVRGTEKLYWPRVSLLKKVGADGVD